MVYNLIILVGTLIFSHISILEIEGNPFSSISGSKEEDIPISDWTSIYLNREFNSHTIQYIVPQALHHSLNFEVDTLFTCVRSKIVVTLGEIYTSFYSNLVPASIPQAIEIRFNLSQYLDHVTIVFSYQDYCDVDNSIIINQINLKSFPCPINKQSSHSIHSSSYHPTEYPSELITNNFPLPTTIQTFQSQNPTISPTYDNVIDYILCELVAATDIPSRGLNWECDVTGRPTSSICLNWDGILCLAGLVTDIRLEFYGIAGTIPDSLGRLKSLTFLQLAGNKLTGTLPTSIGDLVNLNDLWLGSNRLDGSIPTTLARLKSLQVLSLSENSFTGSIPSLLGKLTSLRVLWLSANRFTGTIPPSLGSLSLLYTAYLNSNSLTGSIPSEFGKLQRLMALSLFSNSLVGSIPESFSKLSELTSFRIYGNDLSGSLPKLLCSLSLVDFYPKIATVMGNNRLICYEGCLSSVAFHYLDDLKSCDLIRNTSKPTESPTPSSSHLAPMRRFPSPTKSNMYPIPGQAAPTPAPPYFDSQSPTLNPLDNNYIPPTNPDTNYVLLMTSFFLVIFDVAILSMLILECSGLGRGVQS